MALDPDSFLLREYFTEERLAHLKSLRKRFPLWCGEWPSEVGQVERRVWTLESRADDIAHELASYFGGLVGATQGRQVLFSADLTLADMLDPQRGDLRASAKMSFTDCPLPHYVLSESIEAVGARARHIPLRVAWERRVGSILTGNTGPWVRHPRAKTMVPEGAAVSGAELEGWRERFLQERDSTLGEELRQAWVRVGVEAGIIPDRSGDLVTTLPDAFLADLVEEAQVLVNTVKDFADSSEDLQAVERLLASEAATAALWTFQKATCGMRDPGGTFVKDFNSISSGAEWIFRLRYPLLARDEIKVIRDGPSSERSRPKLARTLLRTRLAKSGVMLSDRRLDEKIKAGRGAS